MKKKEQDIIMQKKDEKKTCFKNERWYNVGSFKSESETTKRKGTDMKNESVEAYAGELKAADMNKVAVRKEQIMEQIMGGESETTKRKGKMNKKSEVESVEAYAGELKVTEKDMNQIQQRKEEIMKDIMGNKKVVIYVRKETIGADGDVVGCGGYELVPASDYRACMGTPNNVDPDGTFWYWVGDDIKRAKYGSSHTIKGVTIKTKLDEIFA